MSNGTGLWHRFPWLAYLAVFIAVWGHATTEFFSVLTDVSGPELSVLRFSLGSIGLVLICLCFKDSRNLFEPLRSKPIPVIGLSLLGIAIGYLFFHWALDFASVPQVATIVTTIPIFVAIANLLINKQAVSTAKIVSAACAIIGIALLLTDGYLERLSGPSHSLVGIFMALACAMAVAVYMVLAKPVIAQFGALRFTALSMLIGAIGLWLLVGAFFNTWVGPANLSGLSATALTAILIVAIWNTTITQFLWIGGLAAANDITRCSYLFFLKPVIAALLAVLILKQPLTSIQVLAIAVITGSVILEIFVSRIMENRAVAD